MFRPVQLPPSSRPFSSKPPDDPFDWLCIPILGAEIPLASILNFAFVQLLGQRQISAKGFKDILPRPRGAGTATRHHLVRGKSPHDIGNQSVFRPIPPADDVSSAS